VDQRAEVDHANVVVAVVVYQRYYLPIPRAAGAEPDVCVMLGLRIQRNLGTLINDKRDIVARDVDAVGHDILAGQDHGGARIRQPPFNRELRIGILEQYSVALEGPNHGLIPLRRDQHRFLLPRLRAGTQARHAHQSNERGSE